ncbi:hypothetical protein LTR97_011833 [Elasticomyces elasticus]|uniref:Zn(2)-C6 fungal-type domain-containing protein n=1 Tax=Elasticomyces elasticus TaxID=574655 RepID=A0AAN7ZZP6_9PEZI|nr:hypothetical protein LTR97_011833 [Elasticomyces elasticus]
MGRKPNPLILEFFERGCKLEDSSNRYAHTCRRCSEYFPKGRVEALLGHIIRHCQNVTQLDRETVFFYMQQPARTNTNSLVQSEQQISPLGQTSMVAAASPAYANDQFHAPEMLVQQQSALDTLAEVSRRHLDYTAFPRQMYPYQPQHGDMEGGRVLENLGRAPENQANVTHPQYHAMNIPQTEQPFELPVPDMDSSRGAADLEQMNAGASVGSLDPQLGQGEIIHHLGGPTNEISAEELMSWNPTNQSGQQSFGAISAPSIEPMPGFGLLSRKQTTRARGRFSDTRRKEVQETRKRGACIRCRMLKKPCSEGDPCNTCANVESARLWKGKCLRSRLADEFNLWSSSLFHSKARIEVPAAVQGMYQLPLEGCIEARFFDGTDLCMSFAAKQHSITPHNMTPRGTATHAAEDCIWLLDEGDSICDKIEAYVDRIVDVSTNNETSVFLQTTVKKAHEMMQQELDDVRAEATSQEGSRSCYNLQGRLVKDTLELWVATNILTSPDTTVLELQYTPTTAPQHLPQAVRRTQGIDPTSPTYRFIRSQMLAAVESRCSRLAKSIINELERRVLQRQQASRFATFISAVLLLSAVERMTGLYRSFDDDGQFVPNHGFTSWPLDFPPNSFWQQGDNFADLLIMLLRMRALPPKTIENPDGLLVVFQDRSLSVRINGVPVEHVEKQSNLAAAWLDPLQLRVDDLQVKRDSAVPDHTAEVGAWDMRFLSKLLLPEKGR